MAALVVTALLWIALHLGVAGTALRAAIVARLGERPFRGLFALVSVLLLVCLAVAYRHAPYLPLWSAAGWLRWLLVAAMLPACWLLVAALATRNPTMIGGEGAAAAPARGVTRLTRHPMLWAFAIWAAVHVIGNGDVAAVVFFGAFLVTALAGMPSIDAKLAARDPARWQPLAAATSIVPGGAILAGRNRLVMAEVGWIAPLGGLVLWLLLLFGHRHLIGVAPVAGLPG